MEKVVALIFMADLFLLEYFFVPIVGWFKLKISKTGFQMVKFVSRFLLWTFILIVALKFPKYECCHFFTKNFIGILVLLFFGFLTEMSINAMEENILELKKTTKSFKNRRIALLCIWIFLGGFSIVLFLDGLMTVFYFILVGFLLFFITWIIFNIISADKIEKEPEIITEEQSKN